MKPLLRSVRQLGGSKSPGVLFLVFASILAAGAAVPLAARFTAQTMATTTVAIPMSAPMAVAAPAVTTATLVVTTTTDSNDGVCDADCSLREAIAAANANSDDDVITFDIPVATDPGCNGGTGPCTINLQSALPSLSANLTIQGPGAGVVTVRRDTGGDYRIFRINNGTTVAISGLTISNGRSFDGGGISNAGTLTVTSSTLSGNYTPDGFTGGGNGAGIYNSGTLTVTNSTLNDNHTGNGFGMSSGPDPNAGGDGGGIYNSGTLTVINSTLSDNTTGIGGVTEDAAT